MNREIKHLWYMFAEWICQHRGHRPRPRPSGLVTCARCKNILFVRGAGDGA